MFQLMLSCCTSSVESHELREQVGRNGARQPNGHLGLDSG